MKRTLALLLALMTVIGLLAGCAKEPAAGGTTGGGTTTGGTTTGGTTTEPTKPAEPYIYYYVRSGEDTTLNPHATTANNDINVVDNCAGMLFWYIPKEDGSGSMIAPIYADGIPTVAADGLTWTIKLVKDAKWPDGEPITADDWIYSWKMVLDPKLAYSNGSSFASNTITIKNAKAYWSQITDGKEVKWEDVGIKKVDDYTITLELTGKVTADEVMRQLYLRSAGLVKEEIYSKCISADGMDCDYGTSFDKIAFAGRFVIESWQKGTETIFVKNENFPRADLIHIDKVISRVVTDESTRLELFEKGEATHIDLGTNGMAKYGEDPRVIEYGTKTINTLEVNQNHADPEIAAFLNDPNFRKAIFYAIDRTAIGKLTDSLPAPYFLSIQGQILEDGTMYRDTPEAKALVEKYAPNNGYDPDKAVKLMDEVLKKNGKTSFAFSITYTETSDNLRAASEYIASQFEKIFGGKIKVELKATSSSNKNNLMRESTKQAVGTWELCWSGWGLAAENYYPWKKFEKYTSTNSTRYTNYKNDKLDAIYAECMKDENRLSDQKLLALTLQGEEAWYEDMTCVPVFGGVSKYLYQEYVQLPVSGYAAGIGLGWYYSTHK